MKEVVKKWISLSRPLLQYNLKLIFAGVFVYFMATALLILIGLIALVAFNADTMPVEEDAYYLLILPVLIVMFYPTAYGIQNDMNARMMEVLIGIPNYRYKVWLLRLMIIVMVVFLITLIFSAIVDLTFIPLGIWEMTWQLMYPLVFIGMFTFFISTIVRSGQGAAAVAIIFMLIMFFSSPVLEYSKWDVFLNPFENPADISEFIWMDTILYNRVILLIASVISLLSSLFLLQKRHRFI